MSRPKIGLALSAGAARGLSHIGVLKVLQEEKIPIDYIAGSSIGGFIGALYANKLDLEMIEGLAIHLKRKDWVDFTFPGLGFVKGDKVYELIKLLTQGKNLEDLSIPTSIVATDLAKGKKVVFREGPIADAVRASISIPGIFEPVLKDGTMLVDGGVVERLPISEVRKMGAEFIIAVDVLSGSKQMKVKNIFDVMMQTLGIMERELLHLQFLSAAADVVIMPQVGDIQSTSFTRVEECIERGEEAARMVVDKLRKRLGETVNGALE